MKNKNLHNCLNQVQSLIMQKNSHTECLKLLNEIISSASDTIEAYELRSEIYSEQGKYELTVLDYTSIINLMSSSNLYETIDLIEAYEQRAGCYMSFLKQYNNAIEDFTKILLLEPNNLRAILYRGFCYEKIGQQELAMKDLELVKLHSDYDSDYSIERLRKLLMI